LTLVIVASTLGAARECGSWFSPSVPAATFSEEKSAVTKKEIVRTISEEIGLTQLQTKEIVQKTFDAIVKALVSERRIELRNFGVFEVKRRAPRKARNPRTGDKVFVPEKFVVTFKPGKEMEERVKELERQVAAARASRSKTPAKPTPQTPDAADTYESKPGET
jgi:integration host factor subunit beta